MPSTVRVHWQDVAAFMQKQRDETIAKVSPAIPDPPQDLPLNVTNAFLRRAGLAQKLANCVTELLPERALERARYLDDYLAEHKKPIGPLHGLPISVKEHIGMKGLNLNAGFISWCDKVGDEDALILQLLWKAGAVFYVRTTQPQTLMHLETSSNLYGVTVNPFNRALTSGGSSGGEGALLGLRGSCMGIGTDIGGSIRSPAANNGIFGLRPTSYRLPNRGCAATMLGQEHIVPVIGPLSTSLDGIELFMKTLIDQKPWLYEPSLLPFPWRDTASSSLLRVSGSGQRKLKVGIIGDDGVVKPHPPVLRALNRLTTALGSHGDVELVDFPPYKHNEAWRIISFLYFADSAAEEKAAIDASQEPWRPLSHFIITDNPNVRNLTVSEVWKLTSEREDYRTQYAAHWNSVSGSVDANDLVDVILCPVGPGVAPQIDTSRYWGYTSQWNLLDYPALVFPTGLKVEPEKDIRQEGYMSRNEKDEYNYNLYEAEKYRDAPIALQLVGRRYEDEKVIEALELITQVAGLPFD
ncbi:hypothetical protein H2203_003487 [Taxawa tesnikishii (nom. ined.)]|nr:hypothetical protein H2203_003487 [Dothideales sp. JES 119]